MTDFSRENLFPDADSKTLRLAAPAVTAESLERYLRYQGALLARVAAAPGEHAWAEAHGQALEASGASINEVTRLTPLCTDFCGKLGTLRRLALKRQEVLARAAPSAKDQALLERLEKEGAKLGYRRQLTQRYGEQAITLLEARQEELLALHQRATATFAHGRVAFAPASDA